VFAENEGGEGSMEQMYTSPPVYLNTYKSSHTRHTVKDLPLDAFLYHIAFPTGGKSRQPRLVVGRRSFARAFGEGLQPIVVPISSRTKRRRHNVCMRWPPLRHDDSFHYDNVEQSKAATVGAQGFRRSKGPEV
jgi:hypothetical protein